MYLLIPEGLAELGNDFTGKYSTPRMPSQVTVLKMYQSNGLWKGTEKKNQRQNPHPWTAKGCGTRSYFCGSMCDPRRSSISAPPAPGGEFPDIGNPDGYQKKGVSGEAKWIVVKTKEIAKVAQIWVRGIELRGNPGKSGVEQFEWSLITLVSLAWLLLLSQDLFYKYLS